MNNPLRSEAATQVSILAMRLSLGALFMFQGIDKIFHFGVSNFVHAFSGKIPDFLPKPIGQTYLYAVPWLEMIIGAMVVLGLFTRTAAAIMGLMLVSYIYAVTGLFMDSSWLHLHFNLCYVAMSIALAAMGGGTASLDRAIFKTK